MSVNLKRQPCFDIPSILLSWRMYFTWKCMAREWFSWGGGAWPQTPCGFTPPKITTDIKFLPLSPLAIETLMAARFRIKLPCICNVFKSSFPGPCPPQNTNVVVVGQQPRPASTTVYRQYSGDYASGALIFAIFATFCVFFFGCWWSLICSIVAIVFAINVSDHNSAKHMGTCWGVPSFSIYWDI